MAHLFVLFVVRLFIECALEAGLGLLEVFLYVRDKRIGVQGSRIYVGFRVGGLNIKV